MFAERHFMWRRQHRTRTPSTEPTLQHFVRKCPWVTYQNVKYGYFIHRKYSGKIFSLVFFSRQTIFVTRTTNSFVLVTRCNFKRFTRSINIRVQISLRSASLHTILSTYINNNNNTWNMCDDSFFFGKVRVSLGFSRALSTMLGIFNIASRRITGAKRTMSSLLCRS